MKNLTAVLLISAFVAAPAFACGFEKTAETKLPTQMASLMTEQADGAMTTFDPASKSAFERHMEAADSTEADLKEETGE